MSISVTEQMKAYIKTHLQEVITSSSLSKSVGYSQYHAARLFKEDTGLSPFEYIRRERLIQSARALRNNKPKVIDVALDFVFDSHEGFTRAFANAFGITPKMYANYPKPDGWLIPYCYLDRRKSKTNLNLKPEEFIDMKTKTETKTAVIFTQIMERPARKLILRRSKKANDYFEYMGEIGCGTPEETRIMEFLHGVKEALYEFVCVWLPDNMKPEGTGVYAFAVEVPADYSGEIPEGFDVIDLEPCKMLVFQGEPYKEEDWQEAIGAGMDLFEKFNPEVYGYEYADELAPKIQLVPMGWRGYIEMRPVREIEK